MKIVFCGPDTDRKARCEDIARAEGLDVPADINLGFADFGRDPLSKMTVEERYESLDILDRLKDAGANRILIDYEPEGISWSGRSRELSPLYVEHFAYLLSESRAVFDDTGLYGFPANRINRPYVPDTASNAIGDINARAPIGAFYPSLYFSHLISDTTPYDEGGLEADWHAARFVSCITASKKVADGRPVRPCFMGHIELKEKAWHLARLTEREVKLWFGLMHEQGIEEVVWWMDNEDDLEDQIRRYAPWIRSVTEAA